MTFHRKQNATSLNVINTMELNSPAFWPDTSRLYYRSLLNLHSTLFISCIFSFRVTSSTTSLQRAYSFLVEVSIFLCVNLPFGYIRTLFFTFVFTFFVNSCVFQIWLILFGILLFCVTPCENFRGRLMTYSGSWAL